VLTVATLLLSQAPALARWHREAREGINVLRVCPQYVAFEAASIGPVDGSTPPTFTISMEAYSPPPATLPPAGTDLVLRQDVTLPLDPRAIVLDDDEEPTQFSYFGSFVLGWEGGRRLAPGTEVTIGLADTFVPGSQSEGAFETFTVPFAEAGTCETPTLELKAVCAKAKKKLTWRVRNPNPFRVEFTFEVVGTDQSGTRSVRPNGTTTFKTRRVPGANTVRLLVDGQEVDRENACVTSC
jgi:hypothetical protein